MLSHSSESSSWEILWLDTRAVPNPGNDAQDATGMCTQIYLWGVGVLESETTWSDWWHENFYNDFLSMLFDFSCKDIYVYKPVHGLSWCLSR